MTRLLAVMHAWFAAVLLGVAPSAMAQDEMTFDFDLNSVLVASFEAEQPFLETEAERVRALVEQSLGDTYVVITMAEVPAFTDYSAEVYLRSCPDGQYIGCVFVVGGRAQTDWTIGGKVSAVEGGFQVDMSFIDVAEAKLVMEFDVVLTGENDALFQEGVQKVMDALVNGEVQELDVRADPEAARAAEAEAARRAAIASEFAEDSAYEDPDDYERGDLGLDAYVGDDDDDRVTYEDLEEMESQGGLTPWERAGLTKSQYKLYRNSNKKLRDFKRKLQGRKGEILLRASFKVTQGPWGQAHETGLVYSDPAAGVISEQTALQLQTNNLVFGGEFEFGYGVLPWMDIGLFAGLHSSPYVWRQSTDGSSIFIEENVGAPRDFLPWTSTNTVAWWAGLKLGFAPMPAYPARPVMDVGASFWSGTAVSKVVDGIPDYMFAKNMGGNFAVLINLRPGFEINIGKTVVIFARADIDLPVFGRTFQRQVRIGGQGNERGYYREREMVDRAQAGDPEPSRSGAWTVDWDGNKVGPGFGVGIGGSIGLMFRFRVAGLR